MPISEQYNKWLRKKLWPAWTLSRVTYTECAKIAYWGSKTKCHSMTKSYTNKNHWREYIWTSGDVQERQAGGTPST
ncbi:unnamed protein product [Mycena citricolor]|uniref:Uncharacterized protein n=1 Tax=Mycena citricolor TaxID=2018698 RepID=A0AAD2HKH0_9AGAR|nr:unnamed protein product [Mycena citricolor]